MIEVEGLSKHYGPHQALNNVNFSVGKGEVVGFLGPNGAGKSTTMNILTGFLSLSEGNVRINGHDILIEAREARAAVGYLPEQPPLYPELTVTEYLRHVCGLKKLKRKTWQDELDCVLPMCSLREVAHRKIAFLSKGFRQRVGLAQALLGSPPLLILDEPTGGLDPQQILEVRSLIQQLKQEHTILLSSHILSEIEAVCQRVLILNNGKLVADDSTASLGRKIDAESLQLEIQVLGPHSGHELLGQILQNQGVSEFSLVSTALSVSAEAESLFQLEFQLPLSTAKPAMPWFTEGGTSPKLLLFNERRNLSRILGQNGFTIVAMITADQRSLEDVFLNLTAVPKTGKNTGQKSLKGKAHDE